MFPFALLCFLISEKAMIFCLAIRVRFGTWVKVRYDHRVDIDHKRQRTQFRAGHLIIQPKRSASDRNSSKLTWAWRSKHVASVLLAIGFALLAVPTPAALAQENLDQTQNRIQPLRVLYAGDVDHPRTEEFVDFFKTRFAKVSTIAFANLSEQTAADSDVVVIDIPGSDMETFRRISLPERFDRSTILVGINGARLGEKEDIKLNDA